MSTNKSKHTPGPWRAVSDTRVIAPNGHPNGSDARPIAECYDPRWGRNEAIDTWPQDIANARLIAAAPELLEACELTLDIVDRPEFSDAAKLAAIAAISRAAIAKATEGGR